MHVLVNFDMVNVTFIFCYSCLSLIEIGYKSRMTLQHNLFAGES